MDVLIDIVRQVVVMLVSVSVLALIGFVGREYVRRYVDHVFNVREQRLKNEGAIQLELLKNRVPVLSEIVYRLRNQARDVVRSGTPASPACALHRELCAMLTERMYTYRALLEGDAWDSLHEFKHVNQDFSILVDAAGRDGTFRTNKGTFGPETEVRLEELFADIDRFYTQIAPALQTSLRG
jgi:hypothetical protein